MSRKNICDVFGQNAAYVVLKKKEQLQVFEEPTDKVLRKKSKKGWTLVGWVCKTLGEDKSYLMEIISEYYRAVI